MGNAVKALLAAAVAAAALPVAVGNATSAATTTYTCKQVWGSFNVQLIGDRDWGWNLGALGSVGAPKKKSIIVVWSLGGLPAQQGLNIYGWATGTKARPSSRCTVIKRTLKEPSLGGLGPVTRVKDGWAFGRKFGCLETGPLLITTRSKVPGRKSWCAWRRAVGRWPSARSAEALAGSAGRRPARPRRSSYDLKVFETAEVQHGAAVLKGANAPSVRPLGTVKFAKYVRL